MVDFGWALVQMKAGKQVRRAQWLEIHRPVLRMFIDQPEGYVPSLVILGGGMSGELKCLASDLFNGIDLLAEDWELY